MQTFKQAAEQIAETFAQLNVEQKDWFAKIKRGIERECLRITPDGHLSQTAHPQTLGSALTNPYITTDYSEALLELITPPIIGRDALMQNLFEIHQFVYENIGDELLWSASMPCIMGDEKDIPIAQYGSSNVGQMKHIYRVGLAYRYGKLMQTIAGVHYNFSLPTSFWPEYQKLLKNTQSQQDFISEQYMSLVRNFLRYSWMIPYLYGASPAVCKSFVRGYAEHLQEYSGNTFYGPYATSLRMSDMGYTNNAQSCIDISYNSLAEYTNALEHAIHTSEPAYEKIGVKVDGVYRQLNSNILQIENEFYGSIRPKQITESGERPTLALKRRGIQYIEVRALDIHPFSPVGITEEQIDFLDMFLIFCLLAPSEKITVRCEAEMKENLRRVVSRGRDPKLQLLRKNQPVDLKVYANEMLDAFTPIAQAMDVANATDRYSQNIAKQKQAADNPELTLSGTVVNEMKQMGDGFFPYAMQLSQALKNFYDENLLSEDKKMAFARIARGSIESQAAVEQGDSISFESYLNNYFK